MEATYIICGNLYIYVYVQIQMFNYHTLHMCDSSILLFLCVDIVCSAENCVSEEAS